MGRLLSRAIDFKNAVVFLFRVVTNVPRLRSPETQAAYAKSGVEGLGARFERLGRSLEAIDAISLAMRIRRRIAELCGLGDYYVLPDVVFRSIGMVTYLEYYLKNDILSGTRRYYVGLDDPAKFLCPLWTQLFIEASDHRIIIIRNRFLRQILRRWLSPVCPTMLDWVIPMNGEPVYLQTAAIAIQQKWEESGCPPLIDRHEFLRKYAGDHLKKAGIRTWFEHACLHVRESGYKDDAAVEGFRNAAVSSYLPAVDAFAQRGMLVVRMGDPSMSPAPKVPALFDYARSDHKSELLDLLIVASAKCYLGTASGLLRVAQVFGVPSAVTNHHVLALMNGNENDISCPKRLFSEKAGRELTFSEMVARPVARILHHSAFDENGLTMIDNTADQLAEVARELIDVAETGRPPERTVVANAVVRDRIPASGLLSYAFLSNIDVQSPEHLGDFEIDVTSVSPELLAALEDFRRYTSSFAGGACLVHDPLDRWNQWNGFSKANQTVAFASSGAK